METKQLLDYCWKHKLIGEGFCTSDGKSVEVVDSGLHNRHEGPTFFNAKVRIEHTLWVGNAQTLVCASDWYVSMFDRDSKYDNVVLIVCQKVDSEPLNSKGEKIPVAQMEIPENVTRNYGALIGIGGEMLCHYHIMQYASKLIRHAWHAAMQTEWIEEKADHISELYKSIKDWDSVWIISLFRSFGFVVNDGAMEQLAKSIPLNALAFHNDDLFQIEAVIFGQAGLLELDTIPEDLQKHALNEGYFAKLRNEYLYLAHKYSMKPMAGSLWKPLGTGCQKYVHVFLSVLANYIYQWRLTKSVPLARESAKQMYDVLSIKATPYWQMHYHFVAETKKSEKGLSLDRKSLIMASSFIPFLFCYGRRMQEEKFCDTAFDIMEQMKRFSTPDTKCFEKTGYVPETAGDAIAMIQLKREYCDKKDCIRCRFGFEFIKKH